MKTYLHGAALLLVLLLGSVPFWSTLGFWPMTTDPIVWISKGALSDPNWAQWVFGNEHYSWYRPLVAFSFTLNHALGGFDPLGYRLVDLGLHLGAGALCYALLRALAPSFPRVLPLLAAALFLAHGGSDEVVPFMARRSYSMAMVFGLSSLVLLARALRRLPLEASGRALFPTATWVGFGFVGALYSNEGALLLVVAAPFLCLQIARERGLSHRTWILPSAIPALLLVVALTWRQMALGGLGGYAEGGFGEETRGEILTESLNLLLGLPSLTRHVGSGAAWGAMVAAGLLFLGAAVACSGRLRSTSERWMALFAAWACLDILLFAATRSWFPRQIYLVQAPLALLVATTLGTFFTDESLRRSLMGKLAACAALAVALAILLASPVLHGQAGWRTKSWNQRQQIIDHMVQGLDEIEGPATVHVALPNLRPRAQSGGRKSRGIHLQRAVQQPVAWASVVVRERGIELIDTVYVPLEDGPDALTLGNVEDRPAFVAAPGQAYLLRTGPTFDAIPGDGPRFVPLIDLPVPPGRPVHALLTTIEAGQAVLVRE